MLISLIFLHVLFFFVDATKTLVHELLMRYPAVGLMDALGIIYPQYWGKEDCDSKFEKHLKIIKGHYGQSKAFSTAAFPEGTVDPILSPATLDLQASLFKQCMKENSTKMLKKPYDINPVTRLWHSINANSFLKLALSKYLIVAEMAVVMVLGSVQDERTFSMMSFMKSKLRNRLTTNLPLVCAFKNQNFFTLDTFPFDAAYDSWRNESKRQCDTEPY
jgi:hypothetical protein